MKLSIVLPIFNEARTVNELLLRVWNAPLPELDRELVIIESNSTDGTRALVERFVETRESTPRASIKLILQKQALGKGNAVREGLAHVTGDIVLIQDGDLEYDVADYPALVKPILENKADFVLGSRHLAAGSWKIRRFDDDHRKSWLLNLGGIFFHGLFNLLYGQHLTDPTTMYKVFRRTCLNNIRLVSNRFDFDYELVAKLIRNGHLPMEVPVSYNSRGFEEGKKIRILRDPFTWIWAIFKFRFSRVN